LSIDSFFIQFIYTWVLVNMLFHFLQHTNFQVHDSASFWEFERKRKKIRIMHLFSILIFQFFFFFFHVLFTKHTTRFYCDKRQYFVCTMLGPWLTKNWLKSEIDEINGDDGWRTVNSEHFSEPWQNAFWCWLYSAWSAWLNGLFFPTLAQGFQK
jgi:hypothetical protein